MSEHDKSLGIWAFNLVASIFGMILFARFNDIAFGTYVGFTLFSLIFFVCELIGSKS